MFLSICITKWYTMAKLSEAKEAELNERIGKLLQECGVPGIVCRVKRYVRNKGKKIAKKFGLRENIL